MLVKENGLCDLSIQVSGDPLPPVSFRGVKSRVSRESNFRLPRLEIASLASQRYVWGEPPTPGRESHFVACVYPNVAVILPPEGVLEQI